SSRSGNLVQVDIVLFRDLPHERARADAITVASADLSDIGRLRASTFSLSFILVLSRNARLSGWRGRRCSSFGWFRCCSRRRSAWCRAASAVAIDHANDSVYLNSCAFLNLYFFQYAAGWSGNLGVDFVGGDLKKRFVALYFISRLLQPFGKGAFEDGFAHLRHDYICWHAVSASKNLS